MHRPRLSRDLAGRIGLLALLGVFYLPLAAGALQTVVSIPVLMVHSLASLLDPANPAPLAVLALAPALAVIAAIWWFAGREQHAPPPPVAVYSESSERE